jgi:hypothetical protein
VEKCGICLLPTPVGLIPYDPVPHDPVPYDPVPYDPVPYDPAPYDPVPYDPVPKYPGHTTLTYIKPDHSTKVVEIFEIDTKPTKP